MSILARIETYLKRSRTSATRFGREAARDPKLVHDLRCGRELRRTTIRRLEAFLERAEAEAAAAAAAEKGPAR
jgi:2,4-dienoyl-CoA reductase-like NADH-dependent reductase (Old Yellow Enzyme family)